jgi:hypothetical protein
MNPSLILCLIVCPLSLIGSGSLFHFGQPVPASLMALIACWPIGIAGWQLIRFTIRDPDRLQREQHVEKMLQIRNHLGIKADDTITEIPLSTDLTSNPRLGVDGGE